MIKFITPTTIEGEVKIVSPNDMIEVHNPFISPTAMQLQLSCGNKKVIRDLIYMKNGLSLGKPNIPQDFIESNKKISLKILLFIPDGVVDTNVLDIEVNKKTYETILKSGDRIAYLENEIGELKRLITIAAAGSKLNIKLPEDLGKPRQGMVITALTDTIIGWSDLFKDVIVEINDIKTVDGKVIITAKDIKLENGMTTQELYQELVQNNKTLKETLELLKGFSEELSAMKKSFEEYKNMDVI